MHDLDSRVHRLLKAWLAFILKVVQLSHNGVESITMEDISRTIRCGKKCGSNHSRQVMYYLPMPVQFEVQNAEMWEYDGIGQGRMRAGGVALWQQGVVGGLTTRYNVAAPPTAMLPLIQRLHHGFPQTTTISMQSSHFIVSEFPISEGFVEYHLEQKHLAIIWLKSDPKVKPKHQHLFVSKREGRPTNYGCVRRRPLAFAAVLIGGALC